ncbi:GNAT family N-acetyltransferase [Microvirga sp. TS319]|uniref:GNAT family N-acetyltransferase n=1 Tax=Microvirga sp. TS319 TaxID=3241165 RepID=UPI00351A7488
MYVSRQWQDENLSLNLDGTTATVQVSSALVHLEALEEQWHALAHAIPWPMVQFEWIISAARTLRCGRLCIVTVQEAGALQAIAPLVLRRYRLTHQLECLDYELWEPQRLVARDGQYLQLLFMAIQKLRYPFILRGVPAECQEVQHFESVSGPGLRLVTASGSQDSFVPFDGPDSDLEKRVSPSRRSTLRRKRRLAEKHGPVQFVILRPRPGNLPELLDELFRVESSGWKGRAGTGLQYDPQRASFFRMYCDRIARAGCLRLGFMKIGEVTAAVRLDVLWGNKSWELKIGYDEHFADCSPGLLLCHEALKHGQAEGLLGHHFLGSAEPWHDTWTAETTERVTLRYYPATVDGGASLLWDGGLKLGRSLVRRF